MLLVFVAALACAQEVSVHDASGGCYGWSEHDSVWTLAAAHLGERRRISLAAPERVPDLLGSVGITPDVLAAHRDEILATAMPRNWKDGDVLPELPPHLERLFGWDHLHEAMEREVRSQNWGSTYGHVVDVVLPGEPEIRLRSQGLAPCMLPWRITAAGRTWSSDDVRVSRAVLPLLAPEGPSRRLLDGASYWSEGFWSDDRFWRRWVGGALDQAFSENEYVRLEGYELANGLLRVDEVITGNINGQPLSMFFELSARRPSAIDELRWFNPIVDGVTTHSWHDLLLTWRDAMRAVEREAWIGAWRRAGPERTVGLEVVGARGVSQTRPEQLVLPAWRDAGFTAEPDFELLFRRGRKWCATVYLARDQPGALIDTAKPEVGGAHWLDVLDVSFHPRGKPPTYGRVDAVGGFELRTLR